MKTTIGQRSIQSLLLAGLFLSLTSLVSAQTGVIEKVWVEHDVKVKGRVGLRIHAKYSVKNALKADCYLRAVLEREDGHSLERSKYAMSDGRIALSHAFKPPYASANYPDTSFFIRHDDLFFEASSKNAMTLTVFLVGGGKLLATSEVVKLSFPFGAVVP